MRVHDFMARPMDQIKSAGQALTNACDMNCPQCYSRPYVNNPVSIDDCELVLRAFPGIREINFGTGETYLNSKFLDIFRFYSAKGIRLALTTNGNTLKKMKDSEIATFLQDVDVSLDFPQEELHDRWRIPGAFKNAIVGIERCKNLNINVSIAMALTNKNYRYLPEFSEIINRYSIVLRINVYKPVHDQSLALSYDEFWEAIRLIADNFGVMGSSEPLLSLIWDNPVRGSPCGTSIRIHTDLSISGCVYLSNNKVETSEFFKLSKKIPDKCGECRILEKCRGGCLSRRILQVGISNPDFYCPIARGKEIPKIKLTRSPLRDLIHLNYLCTILLSRRPENGQH